MNQYRIEKKVDVGWLKHYEFVSCSDDDAGFLFLLIASASEDEFRIWNLTESRIISCFGTKDV